MGLMAYLNCSSRTSRATVIPVDGPSSSREEPSSRRHSSSKPDPANYAAMNPAMFGRTPRSVSRPLLVAHAKEVFSLLSTAQQQELVAAFQRFDVNGNGTIKLDELQSVLCQLGMNSSEFTTRSIFGALDVDDNGEVEWAEFSALMANRWLGQDGEVDLEHAAALFVDEHDPEGNTLSVQKIRELLGSQGEKPLDQAEMDALIALADPRGTGRVPVEDFLALDCWVPPPLTEAMLKESRPDPRPVPEASSQMSASSTT